MRTVHHVACVTSPSTTSSQPPSIAGEMSRAVTSSPPADGCPAMVCVTHYEAHSFPFDRLCHVNTSHKGLSSCGNGEDHVARHGPSDVLQSCPVAAPHTIFVVHGAEGADAYTVFRSLIADILARPCALNRHEGASPGSSLTAMGPGAEPFVEYSIVRIYSWGATDVLRREAVEDNMSTPGRMPHVTGTTEITLARRCRASLTTDADLRPLWDALERARLVPEWHSALCCSLYAPTSVGGFGTVKLLLLPGLQRANHLLRHDLLQLRLWLAQDTRTSRHGAPAAQIADQPALACRLKEFLVDCAASEDGLMACVYVLTVLRPDTTRLEETALNAWFGSVSATEPSQTRTHFAALLGGSKDATSPSRELPFTPSPRSDGGGSAYACGNQTAEVAAPLPVTPLRASSGVSHQALTTSQSAPRREANDGDRAASAAVRASDEALTEKLAAAEREIRALTQVKEGLESLVAELMVELSHVLTEVDDSMDGMIAEVGRAEHALRAYQATTATQQRTELRRIERRLASLTRAPSE